MQQFNDRTFRVSVSLMRGKWKRHGGCLSQTGASNLHILFKSRALLQVVQIVSRTPGYC
jgi:hypothetical protein